MKTLSLEPPSPLRKIFTRSTRNLALIGLLAGTSNLALAVPVTWGVNGHDYEVVVSSSISWDDSRAAAQALGTGWDLATITSMGEQSFMVGLLGPSDGSLVEYYIGGVFDSGAWNWVTGEAFAFTYWGGGEPNGNAAEPHIALDGRYNIPNWGWNDYTGDGASFVYGFVAERASVAEPASLGLFGLGLAALCLRTRKRKA